MGERLLKTLGVQYPIVQAGMAGGVTTPELVASVSEAGGLGSLGAGYMDPEDMRKSIREMAVSSSKPFAVNVFVPENPEASDREIEAAQQMLSPFYEELGMNERVTPSVDGTLFDRQIDVIIQEHVPVCSFTFGLPSHHTVERLKDNGIILIGTATTVEEAILNERQGMDAVVAQGSEAGGHRGSFLKEWKNSMIGTMSLVPQIVDHVDIPVIGAGGIMDGRGVKAALALGAEGAQLGTAFVTCKESGANPLHKEAILQAKEMDTVITTGFSGKPARGIQNRFIEQMDQEGSLLPYPLQNSLTKPLRKAASQQKNTDYMSLWSGQSPRLSQRRSAKDLIGSIVTHMEW